MLGLKFKKAPVPLLQGPVKTKCFIKITVILRRALMLLSRAHSHLPGPARKKKHPNFLNRLSKYRFYLKLHYKIPKHNII